jgi:hypothetical protein
MLIEKFTHASFEVCQGSLIYGRRFRLDDTNSNWEILSHHLLELLYHVINDIPLTLFYWHPVVAISPGPTRPSQMLEHKRTHLARGS